MTANEHQRKFENIEALLNEKIMDVNTTTHCDWVAVVMHYGAVHLVEKKLAARKTPMYSANHSVRNKEARDMKAGPKLYGELMLLHNASQDARYNNKFFTNDEIKELLDSYNLIKNILGA